MTTDHRLARSFGSVADAYHQGRPSYPDAAVEWLVGREPRTVLELGAGTGKLTERLVALGHDVHATEPDEAMLEVLRTHVPDVRTSATSAEEIPLADRSVDVVVAGQAFHWFDPARALPEIARVLRPGGHLALVWNERDGRIPWVRKLGRILGDQEQLADPSQALADSDVFSVPEQAGFGHWQVVNRVSLQQLARSRSNIAVLDDAERERVLADLLELYDGYGRGMDGMQLPYHARCWRSEVVPRPVVPEATVPLALDRGDDDGHRDEGTSGGRHPLEDSASTIPRIVTDTADDTATLLIDFR